MPDQYYQNCWKLEEEPYPEPEEEARTETRENVTYGFYDMFRDIERTSNYILLKRRNKNMSKDLVWWKSTLAYSRAKANQAIDKKDLMTYQNWLREINMCEGKIKELSSKTA